MSAAPVRISIEWAKIPPDVACRRCAIILSRSPDFKCNHVHKCGQRNKEHCILIMSDEQRVAMMQQFDKLPYELRAIAHEYDFLPVLYFIAHGADNEKALRMNLELWRERGASYEEFFRPTVTFNNETGGVKL